MANIGQIIENKYEILKRIGKGGMSEVYLAMDRNLNKQWAVKEIKKKARDKNNEVVIQSAIAEANMMKKLDHPCLPRIVDIIDRKNVIYVVMDYIEGEPLSKILEKYGAQPQETVIEWAKELAGVLEYLHMQDPPIIYRDMKPANVMLQPNGHIKLIDFGIAREYKEQNVEDTVSLGTKGYAAPEQFGGKGQTDPRTDIYCLGVTLYHLVTGQNPCEPPYELYPIRHWKPELSAGLESIILKCTQMNPQDRYSSCAELLYALQHYEEEDEAYKKQLKRKLKIFVGTLVASQIRERFAASAKESFEEIRCEKEEIQSLTELLVTYKIQIFLSMGSGQSATFTQVASEGLDVLEQTLSGYEKMEDKDYFIPCYPNFVILSDAEAYLRIGKKVAIDEMSGEISMGGNWDIWLRGLEVEASYVAAGMFAACQDSDYLSAHFRRGINTDNPGVGYRFSEEANAEHTVSDMLSDTREWSKALTQEIQKRARGVVFAQKNGQMQILTDRTFAYSGEKRLLVSMVQTITYIERTLQKETQDFKKNLILQFFQKRPGSVLADWMSEEQNCINPVLRQEETLTYQMNEEEDSCVFTVDFGGSRLTRKNKAIVLDE